MNVPLHHGSHTDLLEQVEAGDAPPSGIDAIVVPTSRPVNCLRGAIRLARELDSLVVVLCSGSATADEAAAVGASLHARVVAIDVGGLDRLLPVLDTSQLLMEPRFRHFRRRSDLSIKRNLGLLLARAAGWQRVLFLDDDIARVRAAELRAAAGLLPEHRVVGLSNCGFPDNSVVCHAYRHVGGAQGVFIGGGAMLVAADRVDSFFPNVYNEDWFFLYDALAAGSVAVSGRMSHKKHDPFADPRRARLEEFGDLLAEGLYRLLDVGDDLARADLAFWQRHLHYRRQLIETILGRLRRGEGGPRRDRMIASLEAAQRVSSFITPTLCVDFLQAWGQDRERWRQHVSGFGPVLEVEKALAEFGLAGRFVTTRPAPLRSAPPAVQPRAASLIRPDRDALRAPAGR
ncbi:MAG: hypothetical protein ACRDT2_06785 [Natronosporangium sp.]